MQPVDRIPPQPWMIEPATRAVLAALTAEGGTARFVGGCVRDALLGRPISDIDIATPEPPERVLERLQAAGIKAIPTGIAHGTVTAVVAPRHFEITSLRRDVETFGRHARVAFTDDWAEDAARRDFTMNALFLDGEGQVFDPVEGLADLRAGHVRFVGDAATRIGEDVLRLLRFYRFHAHYGRGEADPAARQACRALAHLLPRLSGERLAGETLRLLKASDPLSTLRLMQEDGVLAVLLPETNGLDRLAGLLPLEPKADALRRLAALLPARAEAAESVARRLRFSVAERERLMAMVAPPWPVELAADAATQRRALHHLGLALYGDVVLLRAAERGEDTRARELLAAAPERSPPPFPLRGRDAQALGVTAGPAIGKLLAAVEAWWEAGDYRADRAACLAKLAAMVEGGAGTPA